MSDGDEEPRKFETPYPGYNVLDKWDTPSFNEATRRVVTERMRTKRRQPRFFRPDEYELLRAVMDTVLPQDERSEEERIPVEAFLDEKLDSQRHRRHAPCRHAAAARGLADRPGGDRRRSRGRVAVATSPT